jgi:hypothetical protein
MAVADRGPTAVAAATGHDGDEMIVYTNLHAGSCMSVAPKAPVGLDAATSAVGTDLGRGKRTRVPTYAAAVAATGSTTGGTQAGPSPSQSPALQKQAVGGGRKPNPRAKAKQSLAMGHL